MPTHLPVKLWNVYRNDVEGNGPRSPVAQVRARDRREALDKAVAKLGPDSRGWLYAYTVTGERAVAALPNHPGTGI